MGHYLILHVYKSLFKGRGVTRRGAVLEMSNAATEVHAIVLDLFIAKIGQQPAINLIVCIK